MKPREVSAKVLFSFGLLAAGLFALGSLLLLWPDARRPALSNLAGPGASDSNAWIIETREGQTVRATASATAGPLVQTVATPTASRPTQPAATPVVNDLPLPAVSLPPVTIPALVIPTPNPNRALQTLSPEYVKILDADINGPLGLAGRSPVAGQTGRYNFASPGPYNPIAPPTINLAAFIYFLQQGQSPALPEAAAMYAACLRDFCDPAVALAFFEHESSMGKYGVAARNKSFGNIRCVAGARCTETAGNGSFKLYLSWTEGLTDWAVLLRDNYGARHNLYTLEQIIPRYAPAADNNNPQGYINTVKNLVDKYRRYRP